MDGLIDFRRGRPDLERMARSRWPARVAEGLADDYNACVGTHDPVPSDTDPEAYAVQLEAYRRMGGKGRTAVMFGLTEVVRKLAVAGIRARHPRYDEESVRMALFRLRFGDELARRIFPGRDLPDP